MNNSTSIPVAQCTFYGFTDPAGSKQGRTALALQQAQQAIVVIAVSPLLHVLVVFAWADKIPATKYVDKLISVHERYHPKVFGIESNAMQKLFADLVRAEAKKRLSKVSFMAIDQPTNIDKDFRIRTVVEPVINYGRLLLNKQLVELESQLAGFPTAHRKDLVDALASCLRLIPKRPEQVVKNEEIERLASYLRATGAPTYYIEQRIREEREKYKLAALTGEKNGC